MRTARINPETPKGYVCKNTPTCELNQVYFDIPFTNEYYHMSVLPYSPEDVYYPARWVKPDLPPISGLWLGPGKGGSGKGTVDGHLTSRPLQLLKMFQTGLFKSV
jgi:hypothetical protein